MPRIIHTVKYPRKRKKKKKPSRLEKYAARLNKNVPASEVWFRQLYKDHFSSHKLTIYKDQYNYVIGAYIVDMINIGYKYIVEIDGRSHEGEIPQWKDKVRDINLSKKGYTVIRIKAYDLESYKLALDKILNIRIMNVNNYIK